VPRTFANAATGYLVEGLGWFGFFCTVLAFRACYPAGWPE
jgi:hypothetical protein